MGVVSQFERKMLTRLLRSLGSPPLSVILWDGQAISVSPQSPVTTVTIRDRRTLWKLALDPFTEFGEAYTCGRIEVAGDLEQLLTIAYRSSEIRTKNKLADRLLGRLHRGRANTLKKSRDNVAHHYDIGNDFYQLWLDEQLLYTCAYFTQPTLSLEAAQMAKMDHVCRKLRLRPGQSVMEAGCGWGALALHMGQYYGVRVKAFNVSREQISFARSRARRLGLEDRVEFVEDDWRNMQQSCDAFVSVGMLEHVGPANYRHFGDVIDRCLLPHGLGLIHTIGQNRDQPLNAWIERRIFPGAHPPTLRQMMDIFEPHGLSILDVENLRLHYAETLRHWLNRYEAAVDAVREMFDEPFVRLWRMYLTGSLVAFQCGDLQLFQIVFSKRSNNQIPWTREELYASSETGHGTR